MTHILSVQNLLDIPPLTQDDITFILDRAAFFKKALVDKTVPQSLAGKVVLTMFMENSTRTRNSFEMAALRLGATLMNWDEKISSAQKGETFSDTIRYLNGYAPDAIVMRHHEYNAPHFVQSLVDCPVINAGDSYREHPTQALLDAFTIREHKGKIAGLTIAIIGDLAHSRVANSNMALFTTLGATIHLIAPKNLQPQKIAPNVKVFETLEDGLRGCDVVYVLRIQKERMDASQIPDDGAYFHAQWRRDNPLPYGEVHTILDGVQGHGHYVGTYIAWGSNSNGWWGEGEIRFYIDGDRDFPTINGTGEEDYFLGSYGYAKRENGALELRMMATGEFRGARCVLSQGERVLMEVGLELSPRNAALSCS